MMAELVRFVTYLEKFLFQKGESKEDMDILRGDIEKEQKVREIRENPHHQGQDFVHYYGALRESYLKLLETKYGLKTSEIVQEYHKKTY